MVSMRSQDRHVKGTGSCLRRAREEGWVSSWGHSPARTQAAARWQRPGAGYATAGSHGICRANRGLSSLFVPIPNLLADAR